jgi:hypothetical protein
LRGCAWVSERGIDFSMTVKDRRCRCVEDGRERRMGGSDGRFVFAVGCGESIDVPISVFVRNFSQTSFSNVLNHEQGSVAVRI